MALLKFYKAHISPNNTVGDGRIEKKHLHVCTIICHQLASHLIMVMPNDYPSDGFLYLILTCILVIQCLIPWHTGEKGYEISPCVVLLPPQNITNAGYIVYI